MTRDCQRNCGDTILNCWALGWPRLAGHVRVIIGGARIAGTTRRRQVAGSADAPVCGRCAPLPFGRSRCVGPLHTLADPDRDLLPVGVLEDIPHPDDDLRGLASPVCIVRRHAEKAQVAHQFLFDCRALRAACRHRRRKRGLLQLPSLKVVDEKKDQEDRVCGLAQEHAGHALD